MIKFSLFILFLLVLVFAPFWMALTLLAAIIIALMVEDKKNTPNLPDWKAL